MKEQTTRFFHRIGFFEWILCQILVDNCNETTLITRDIVNKLLLKVNKGPVLALLGLGMCLI